MKDPYLDPWSYVNEKDLVLECPHCGFMMVFSIMSTTVDDPRDWPSFASTDEIPDKPEPVARFNLIKCRNCCDVVLTKQELTDEILAGGGWMGHTIIWPQPYVERSSNLSSKIPEGLRREHEQGMICLEAGAHTAALVMVRRILEGACTLHGFTKRNLVQNLSDMKEMGLIDERLLEWAQALRVMGNTAAHYTDHRVTRDDAREALSLSEALLEYLYVFSIQFKQFKERNSERVKTKGDPSL